jgi:hypothetical protein
VVCSCSANRIGVERLFLPESSLRTILHHFTPVDRTVFAALDDDVRQRHGRDLIKRLVLAAETAMPGTGGNLVSRLVTADLTATDLVRRLDAALEFGRPLETLSPDDRALAARAEIRQEVLHFDRIMDLESLPKGRNLKRRREFVSDGGPLGAAERLLVLVNERRADRSGERSTWLDVSSVPQGLVERTGEGFRLRRSVFPELAAVAVARGDAGARPLLERLESFLIRNPPGVALALADYERTLAGDGPATVAVFTAAPSDGRVELWSAGTGGYAILGRQGFMQRVRAVGRFDSAPIGEATSRYAHTVFGVRPGEWILLTLGGRLDGLDEAALEAELNRRNNTGRILLKENLERLLGADPYVLLKTPRSVPAESSSDCAFLERFTEDFLEDGAKVFLSVEAGHVHSDRDLGAAQRRGIAIARKLLALLGEHSAGKVETEITPMIDDDHVVNRICYSDYMRTLRDNGLHCHDVILETSPIVRAIGRDLLRRAVALDGNGFALERLGGNLYLAAPGLRLELVEDLHESMRLGCILFDTALGIYRTDRARMRELFWHHAAGAAFDVHAAMIGDYDANRDPVARMAIGRRYDALFPETWEDIQASPATTPFLDAYRDVLSASAAERKRICVLNVLENYYQPLEVKVLRTASLLGIPMPLRAIFFSPHSRGLTGFPTDSGRVREDNEWTSPGHGRTVVRAVLKRDASMISGSSLGSPAVTPSACCSTSHVR